MRRFRNLMMLAMMERDVTGQAPVEEICTAVTTVAELAIQHALRVAASEAAESGKTPVDDDGLPTRLGRHYTLYVGGSQPDTHSVALLGRAPLAVRLTL